MAGSVNRRIFYAVQRVDLAADGSSSYTAVHGLTSVGVNTKINLEQVFEMGQLSLYENSELVPDIEVTLEKVLDGWPLIYHLCTINAASASLVGRSTVRTIMNLTIYPDVDSNASGTGELSQCTVSGLFVSNVSYEVPTDGPSKESVTLVGNNKTWSTTSFNAIANVFNGNDAPFQSGVVNRRQHVIFNNAAAGTGTTFNGFYTQLPTDIPGISSSGTNDPGTLGLGFSAHIQSVKTNAALGRDQLLELGRRGPYFRYANFPVEVRTDYQVVALQGDMFSATEAGTLAGGANVTNQTLTLKMQEGTYVWMGTKNRLTSIDYGGANAQNRGGNATMTFSYQTFNDFSVLHPQDPMGFTTV